MGVGGGGTRLEASAWAFGVVCVALCSAALGWLLFSGSSFVDAGERAETRSGFALADNVREVETAPGIVLCDDARYREKGGRVTSIREVRTPAGLVCVVVSSSSGGVAVSCVAPAGGTERGER